MTNNLTFKCSNCAIHDANESRYLACVSTSRWESNNYPAPNSFTTTKDDIKIWKVALCDICMPKSFKVYLINKKKNATQMIGWGSFLLALGVIVMVINPTDGPEFLNIILKITMVGGILFGIVSVPISIVGIIKNSNQIRILNQKGNIQKKDKDKSFIGEGERLIKELEKSKQSEMVTEFPLPQYKEYKDLTMPAKEKGKIINKKFGKGERSIITVGRTIEELEKSLPPEWLVILNK